MQFRIKINPEQRLTRISKHLTDNFGYNWVLVPNTKAAVIFPEGQDPGAVVKSLSIIQQDLKLQIGSRKRQEIIPSTQHVENVASATNGAVGEIVTGKGGPATPLGFDQESLPRSG